MQRTERAFIIRMRRALRLTIAPIFDAIKYDIHVQPELVMKRHHIEEALKYLYVDYGYKVAVWFSRNFEYQKKSDTWLTNLEGWFQTNGAEKVTQILGTTIELMKPVLKDAVAWAADGLSISDISTAIKTATEREGGAISFGRCTTIARTEVIGASNVATHQVASEIGDNLEKSWLTGGLNIRDTHIAAEAQGWIPFNKHFQVGNVKMLHPSDPKAIGDAQSVAAEIINCKCVEIFRTIT